MAVAIDPAHLGVEALGEGIGDSLIVEVVEDVFLPVPDTLLLVRAAATLGVRAYTLM